MIQQKNPCQMIFFKYENFSQKGQPNKVEQFEKPWFLVLIISKLGMEGNKGHNHSFKNHLSNLKKHYQM
jgi:hypothetical protein